MANMNDEEKLKKLELASKIASSFSGGSSGGSTDATSGALGGAMSGASAGMAFGPQGAAIGGALGGVMGIVQAGQKKKEKLAEIGANKEMALAGIASQEEERKQALMARLGIAFQQSLLRR